MKLAGVCETCSRRNMPCDTVKKTDCSTSMGQQNIIYLLSFYQKSYQYFNVLSFLHAWAVMPVIWHDVYFALFFTNLSRKPVEVVKTIISLRSQNQKLTALYSAVETTLVYFIFADVFIWSAWACVNSWHVILLLSNDFQSYDRKLRPNISLQFAVC